MRKKWIKNDWFFYLLFGCYTTNFRQFLKRQPHSPDAHDCVVQVSTGRSPEASSSGWVLKPGRAPSGVLTGIFLATIVFLMVYRLANVQSYKKHLIDFVVNQLNGFYTMSALFLNAIKLLNFSLNSSLIKTAK